MIFFESPGKNIQKNRDISHCHNPDNLVIIATVIRGCCDKIIVELEEDEAVLLFDLLAEKTRGLPSGLPSRGRWLNIWQRLADSLLHWYGLYTLE